MCFYDAGNYREALVNWDKALQINPDDHEAWNNRGVALRMLGRYEEAIASYDRSVAIKPHQHEVWDNRGNALDNLGRYEEAIASYDRAVAIKPDYYEAWYSLGFALDNLGRYEEAIASYDRSVAIKPDYHKAWNNRGNTLNNLGRYEESIASYNQAIAIKSDFPQAWYNRGNVLCDLGLYEEAIASYEQAVAIKLDYHKAWYNRGNVLCDLELYEKAFASYEQAVAIKPDDYESWYKRGIALYKLGRYREAIDSYEQAVAIQPDSYEVWLERGVALRRLGRYEEALTSFDQAVTIKPNFLASWYNRGNLLDDMGWYPEAIASYDRALKLKPDYYWVLNNRGWTLYKSYRYQEAIASYYQALAIKPGHITALLNLGWALYRCGHYQEALFNYNKVLEVQFYNLDAWNGRGWAIFELRGYYAALRNWDEGLQQRLEMPYQEGRGILHWQKAKGHYRYGREQADPQPYWQKAKDSYQEALKFLTAALFSEQHLEILQELIQLYQGLGETNKVTALLNEGTDLLARLLRETPSPGRKKQIDRKFESFNQLRVDELAFSRQNDKQIAALELAEERKNICLSWLGEGKVENSPKYPEIQTLLDPKTAAIYWHISPAAMTAFILRYEESPIILMAGEQGTGQRPVLRENGEGMAANRSAGVSPAPGTNRSAGVSPAPGTGGRQGTGQRPVLREGKDGEGMAANRSAGVSPAPGTGQRPVLRGKGIFRWPWRWPWSKPDAAAIYAAASRQLREFEEWAQGWKQEYQNSRKKEDEKNIAAEESEQQSQQWRDSMPEALERLREILEMDRILPLLEGIERLILIPHRDLHLLPLEALFPEELTAIRLPSARVGLDRLPNCPTPENLPLLCVEHPQSQRPLLFAEIEAAAIVSLVSPQTETNCQRLAGTEASKERLLEAFAATPGIFHFTGHAYHNLDFPGESALILAKKERLTLSEILNKEEIPSLGYYLVSLSACETGLTSTRNLTDEFVGLVSGFLAKGTTYVISTLWIVEEIAAALIMIRFYQLLSGDRTNGVNGVINPCQALKEAKRWLRTVSYPELAQWYLDLAEGAGEDNFDLWQSSRRLANNIQEEPAKMNSTQPPYEHPYYWAGFAIAGKVNDQN